jgi:hypothetical protein
MNFNRILCHVILAPASQEPLRMQRLAQVLQDASSWVINPFERVLLQVAIESSELSLRKLKRIKENDAVF